MGSPETQTASEGAPRASRRERICALIVTYHPASSLRKSLSVLSPQVEDLVIVDNGSGSEARLFIEELCSTFNAGACFNDRNMGIAQALNQGVAYAMQRKCDFAVLFDQDSCVNESFIDSMLATYSDYLTANNGRAVGVVVPNYVDERSGAPMLLPRNKDGTVRSAMTSGSFVPMTTFERCGLFEESLFIDYVDMEFCLRLSAEGLAIVQASSATLLHSLGRVRTYRVAGITFSATHHSAGRRYYISRNRTIIYRRYLRARPGWVARDFWSMAMETIKIILVEEDRLSKLRSTLTGIRDGLLGRTGYRERL